MIRIGAALAALLVVLTGCAGAPAPQRQTGPGCISGFDPAADHFPVKAQFTYATNVTLRYERSYQVLTVRQPYPGGAPESYVLLRCGAPTPQLPPELAGAPVIETPVRSVYSESTTQLPMLVELGGLGTLSGVATPDAVSDRQVRQRIDEGVVRGFAAEGQIDTESVVAAGPDVLLGQGADNPAYPALRAAGIPVIGWADYLDSGPLGQAEWIKVMGALTGREAEAQRVFDGIERRYTETAARAANVADTPVVLGQLFQGSWSVPSGASTTGTLIRDAGGTWSEAANPATGSVVKDFEAVFSTDGAAPVWLADGPFPTPADIAAADPRYTELAATRTGRVWTRDRRIGPTGGNDYYERGVTHPDEVLADLVAVLHPELAPDHEFVYHRRVGG